MNGEWIRGVIEAHIEGSPENTLENGESEPAFEEVLVGFANGADPLFEAYKEHVGPFHFTPLEIFGRTFPEEIVSPQELTVVSWILPQREATKAENRAQTVYSAERWVRCRILGERFNARLREHVVEALREEGIPAVAPQLSPHWAREVSPRYGKASRWSERHAAYAAGLGTFGLSDGLITARGKAHRAGSVVARLAVPPTPRPYEDHHAYCLHFATGDCMACAERCPVRAIDAGGHDKETCERHVKETCARHALERYGFDGYGCGLCQTGVPCESGIPV
jgi:epoxyqueuosine reductase QueG